MRLLTRCNCWLTSLHVDDYSPDRFGGLKVAKISPAEKDVLKFMSMGLRNGLIADLDAEGQSLLWRAGDLRARWLLNALAEKVGLMTTQEGT